MAFFFLCFSTPEISIYSIPLPLLYSPRSALPILIKNTYIQLKRIHILKKDNLN